jgi:NADH-ubiquinone reductase complex 1 MLRQ subunit
MVSANPWNTSAVYPLWAAMAIAATALTVRTFQLFAYDPDIQVTKAYRKADLVDSDFLEEQATNYRHHAFHRLFGHGHFEQFHIFPDLGASEPKDPVE